MNSEFQSTPDTTVLNSLQEPVDGTSNNSVLTLVLALSMLAMSISFNCYLMKLNTALTTERANQLRAVSQGEQMENSVKSMLNDLGPYVLQHPEVRDILSKYGISVVVKPPPTTVPPIPPPFPKR